MPNSCNYCVFTPDTKILQYCIFVISSFLCLIIKLPPFVLMNILMFTNVTKYRNATFAFSYSSPFDARP